LSDLIHLLPDNIANQIAAGEVIQRPASAVKELLENAVDAGADNIRLFVSDAGKALIQVIDNGRGMNETDARMCFERHATSKISKIEDLFSIKTMGFRGEALASIAAVAQVELKTKRADDTLGTYIEIENSMVKKQEPCSCPTGTNFSMKNLFFNVPARRNFLKSNAAEMRHIVDEFIHVAMSFPEIFFSLTTNGEEIFHLEKGSLKQRIIQILGTTYSSRLVNVEEKTDYLNIYGFAGKPETAKKTRGDQFIFVNNRFIKSAYLNHAIMGAYQDMLPEGSFPLYVLFIDLDPAQLDINVHPTKQEIKFEDEKIVYAFVQAAVKHALAQFSVAPSLDFDLDPGIQQLDAINKPFTEDKQGAASASHLFNSFTQKHQAHRVEPSGNLTGWKSFFTQAIESYQPAITSTQFPSQEAENPTGKINYEEFSARNNNPFAEAENINPIQIFNSYILYPAPAGIVVINQQYAHEKILYEQLMASQMQSLASQQLLFPINIELSPSDSALFNELLPDLNTLGYIVEPFGKNAFVLQATPADLSQGNETTVIEKILEQYKHFNPDIRCSKKEKLIRSMAAAKSIKSGVSLTAVEMNAIIDELGKGKFSNSALNGQPLYVEIKNDFIERLFIARKG
jgi:DNA mismatch repair protein MutL